MTALRRATAPAATALLLVLSGNMLIDAVEVSVVIVALPSVAADFGLPVLSLHWLMTGFALGFGALLLVASRLAARFGRRRSYLLTLVVFAAASLLAWLVQDPVALVAIRVVKGACVAFTAPVGLAIIGTAFPAGPARDRAIAVYSWFGAVGFAVGLLVSALLTPLSWRWTFVFPAPLALGLAVAGLRWIPPDPMRVPSAGRSPRAGNAMPASLLRSAVTAAALNGSYWGLLLISVDRLQVAAGWTPLRYALAVLPASLLLALSPPLTRRLARTSDPPVLILAGMAAALAGYLVYPAAVVPAFFLVGLGFVLAFPALHRQAVADLPADRQGLGGGIYQTSVQLGGAAALATIATLVAHGRSGTLVVTLLGGLGLVVAAAGVRRSSTLT